MLLSVLSLFFIIFESTNTAKPSVNLALETVVEFDDSIDPSLINNIKYIVDQIKSILTEKKEKVSKKHLNFTDFVEEIIFLLKGLNNDDLLDVVDAINEEVNDISLEDTYLDYGRRFLTNYIKELKSDPEILRNHLNDVLTYLRYNNRHRNDDFFFNFLNTLYERESKRKLVDIFNGVRLFRRKAQSGGELRNFIKKVVNEVFLEKYLTLNVDKRRKLKAWLKDYIPNSKEDNEMNNEKHVSSFEDSHKTINNKYKIDLNTEDGVTKRKAIKKKAKTKIIKSLLSTHITLYPENYDLENKDILSDKKTEDSISDVEKKENKVITTDRNEIVNDVKAKTILFRNKKNDFAPHNNKENVLKSNLSRIKPDISSGTESDEGFGKLYKIRKSKKETKYRSQDKTRNVTKRFENHLSNKRRYNLNNFSNIENYTLENNTTFSNKVITVVTDFLTKKATTSDSIKNTVDEKKLKDTKGTNNTKRNDFNITTDNTQSTKYTETKNNTTIKEEITPTTKFDFDNYIKNSDIQNLDDNNQKKEIEQKIKEDLNNLFSSTTFASSNTTTEAFTDVFKDLEDEFGLR